MQCQFISECPFYNERLENMPPTAGVFKKMYCQGNSANCARHMMTLKLGKEKVPSTLMPNNRMEALSAIFNATGA